MQEQLDRFLQLFGENPYIHAVVLIVGALVVAKIVDWLITGGIAQWAKRTKTDLDDRLLLLIHRPIFTTVVIGGLWLATLDLDFPERMQTVVIRVLKTLLILVWLVFTMRACSFVLEALSRTEKRFLAIQPRTKTLFNNAAKLVVFAGAVYFLFLVWGIDVTAWMMSAGIVGIAVGFAAKDTLANLFSGVFILADTPYKTNDFIILDSGERGMITKIGLRSTRLLTRDDIEITIPNAVIANSKIINESAGRWEKERVRIKVSAAYGSDIDQVRDSLMAVARENDKISRHPEPRVRFRSFGDSGLNFELLCWIDEPILRGRVVDALNTAVYKKFIQEAIEIPYPKQDVYVKQLPKTS